MELYALTSDQYSFLSRPCSQHDKAQFAVALHAPDCPSTHQPNLVYTRNQSHYSQAALQYCNKLNPNLISDIANN